ncbi:putative hemolysin [Pseudoruegeria aquimaris]|nr:DUF333 domain-containing protein [Pseudoruegeria aquimaris]
MSFALLPLAALAACTESSNSADEVDLANPAAVFCVQSNGAYEIREDPEGNQYGVCIVDEGEFDAWELYRKAQDAGAT